MQVGEYGHTVRSQIESRARALSLDPNYGRLFILLLLLLLLLYGRQLPIHGLLSSLLPDLLLLLSQRRRLHLDWRLLCGRRSLIRSLLVSRFLFSPWPLSFAAVK